MLTPKRNSVKFLYPRIAFIITIRSIKATKIERFWLRYLFKVRGRCWNSALQKLLQPWLLYFMYHYTDFSFLTGVGCICTVTLLPPASSFLPLRWIGLHQRLRTSVIPPTLLLLWQGFYCSYRLHVDMREGGNNAHHMYVNLSTAHLAAGSWTPSSRF